MEENTPELLNAVTPSECCSAVSFMAPIMPQTPEMNYAVRKLYIEAAKLRPCQCYELIMTKIVPFAGVVFLMISGGSCHASGSRIFSERRSRTLFRSPFCVCMTAPPSRHPHLSTKADAVLAEFTKPATSSKSYDL